MLIMKIREAARDLSSFIKSLGDDHGSKSQQLGHGTNISVNKNKDGIRLAIENHRASGARVFGNESQGELADPHVMQGLIKDLHGHLETRRVQQDDNRVLLVRYFDTLNKYIELTEKELAEQAEVLDLSETMASRGLAPRNIPIEVLHKLNRQSRLLPALYQAFAKAGNAASAQLFVSFYRTAPLEQIQEMAPHMQQILRFIKNMAKSYDASGDGETRARLANHFAATTRVERGIARDELINGREGEIPASDSIPLTELLTGGRLVNADGVFLLSPVTVNAAGELIEDQYEHPAGPARVDEIHLANTGTSFTV